MKKGSLNLVILSLSLVTGSLAHAQCGHPYCSGPGVTTAPQTPTISNPQFCGEGRCYPGAYIPGAINANGDTNSPPETATRGSAAELLKAELAKVGVEKFTDTHYKPGIVKHIVLFRYAANVTSAQKNEVTASFLALQKLSIRNGKNYIVAIQTGGENSGEGADQGLEQGFIVTFKSEGDRNYYVGQPVVTDSHYYESAHQNFKDFVGPLLDQNGALVFDFSIQ